MVSNGLRQDGILSPLFFNVYRDKRSISLSSCSAGCMLLDNPLNHLMYADDMPVMASSVKGLKNLINICASYAEEHEIVFNSSETVCLCISAKSKKPKFSHCTSSAKATLFQSYFANMYCSHLWWNYGREIYKTIEVAYNN